MRIDELNFKIPAIVSILKKKQAKVHLCTPFYTGLTNIMKKYNHSIIISLSEDPFDFRVKRSVIKVTGQSYL